MPAGVMYTAQTSTLWESEKEIVQKNKTQKGKCSLLLLSLVLLSGFFVVGFLKKNRVKPLC